MLTLHLLMVLERSHNSRETQEWVDVHFFLLHTDKARQRVLAIADVVLAAKVPSILLRIILVIYCWQGL